uniref:Uncharacterized protein n=1 Tax=Romanomermis culicivorax TaxID=13658 RepID=A0A915JL30_ROMCU
MADSPGIACMGIQNNLIESLCQSLVQFRESFDKDFQFNALSENYGSSDDYTEELVANKFIDLI